MAESDNHLSKLPTTQGFLFAAIGDKYIEEARLSASRVKSKMPQAQVCLVTDKAVEFDEFDEVIELAKAEDRKAIKLFKVNALQFTPYYKTIFLDTDTYLCDDVSELFEMVDHVDLLLVPAPADLSIASINGSKVPNFFPYNSGVIVYKKNESTMLFLKTWHETLEEDLNEHPWDQRAMMSAILSCKMLTYALSPIYNLRTDFIVSLPRLPVKIIHGRGVDFSDLETKINSKIVNRVWMPKRNKVIYKKKQSTLDKVLRRVLQKLRLG